MAKYDILIARSRATGNGLHEHGHQQTGLDESLMPWLIVIGFVLGLPLAAELGGRVHRLITRQTPPDPTGAGFLAAGALGLLGLLMGFTFSMATERFETRRALVVSEANAMSTVYLRDQLLGAPYDARLESLMVRYANARLDFFSAGDNPGRLSEAARRTSKLQDDIWRETGQALKRPANAPLATAVLSATNEMFDLASTRAAAREATVPMPIIWAVTFCAFATAGVCGYGLEAGAHRHRVASTILFVLIAVALVLIHDVDSPRGGLIRAPQGPLIDEATDLAARQAGHAGAKPPERPN